MENKIIDRISELSNKINELLEKREKHLHDLKQMDTDINILYSSIYELKNLLDKPEEKG